ncbi:MAG: ABC transporter substrate-binding protein [Bacteroidetes bacterium]|nr:ABC transporter substrate-binding protein [Bacteroidota bacterium]
MIKKYNLIQTVAIAFVFIFLLNSCGGSGGNKPDERQAKGNVFYGGVFKSNEVEGFTSLYPHSITDVVSHRIANQIFEGLIKLSQKDLSILPGIAEKWDKNEDATVWTFYLRKGVAFHDDPCFRDGKGREIDANDFKYSFTKLCEPGSNNKLFSTTFKDRVVGANEYFESVKKNKPLADGLEGVKVIDKYTLQINLTSPFSGFLNLLTTPAGWVFAKEAVEKYGEEVRTRAIGTGPFRVKSIKEGESVILDRNPNYWDIDQFGNQLPYLDALNISFVKEKRSEFMQFKKGNLDMIFRLPIEFIPEILGDLNNANAKDKNKNFSMQVMPAMSTFFLGFQNQLPPFNKKEVRLAFNQAIDREKMATYTLQGEGIPAIYGFVPPSYGPYNHSAIKGFTYNPDAAKKLLAKAGYPNGKGFPNLTLQINAGGGDRNIQIAEVVQKMLKENLNIDVEINVLPLVEHRETIERGQVNFWRMSWIGDYPDPETFLTLFYGAIVPDSIGQLSSPNTCRFKNARFDSLFVAALKENDTKRRFDFYRQADQIIIDEAACMPIFYDENYRLLQNNVRNFDANAMEYRDFTRVYFDRTDSKKKVETAAKDTTK